MEQTESNCFHSSKLKTGHFSFCILSKGQYFAKPVFTQENSYSETFKEQLKMKVLCTVQYSTVCSWIIVLATKKSVGKTDGF